MSGVCGVKGGMVWGGDKEATALKTTPSGGRGREGEEWGGERGGKRGGRKGGRRRGGREEGRRGGRRERREEREEGREEGGEGGGKRGGREEALTHLLQTSFSLLYGSLLVLAALVLEPDPNNPGTETSPLHQMFLKQGIGTRVGCIHVPQGL